MTLGAPDISVIIPSWNAAGTIERAVRSVLGQRNVSVEVVVVDDASTDATADIVRKLANQDDRVLFLRQSKNAGPAVARNRALEVTKARYVTPLDSDDFMEGERLALLLDLARSEDCDIVADDLFKVSAASPDASRQRLWSNDELGVLPIDLSFFIEGNLSTLHGGRSELGFLKPLMSKAFLDRHKIRYDPKMRLGEDYLLYATALVHGARFCLTDPKGYIAVVRPDSLSGRHGAKELEAVVDADTQLLSMIQDDTRARSVVQRHRVEAWKKWAWMRLIEAVKSRDLREAVASFRGPPQVAMSLIGNLSEQLYLRTSKRLRRDPSA